MEVKNIKKKPHGGQVVHQNITHHVPANHRKDGWGGGGSVRADININLLPEQLELAQPS